MNTTPIRELRTRKPPGKRLFSGVAGSPLAHVNEPAPAGTSKLARLGCPNVTRMRDMVLLHYCFDQQAGETKKEHCFCEERAERVHHDLAERFVNEGLADWLIVKNSRSKTGTSIFRRSIVMRSVVIGGGRLFARPSEWKSKRLDRDEKHEAIKVTIRDKAKNLLRKMFSMGLIAQEVFQRLQDDAELDSLFTDVTRAEKFLQMLTSQEQLRFKKRFTEILFHWWNNVLGFHRLDIEAGTIMKQASAGAGEIVYKANAAAITDAVRGNSTVNPGIFIPDPTGEEDPFIDNGGRRVPVSCHVAQPWDPAGGTDPRRFEGGDESPDEGLQDQHWPDESEDESTKPEESMD